MSDSPIYHFFRIILFIKALSINATITNLEVSIEANSITDMTKKAYEYLSKPLKSIWDWIKSKFTKESEEEVEVLEGEFMVAADEVDSSDKRTTPDVSNIV